MKNPTLTIQQNSDGTQIEGLHFDVDYKQGYSAGNLLMLMIKEGLDNKECCEIMKKLADKLINNSEPTDECQKHNILH